MKNIIRGIYLLRKDTKNIEYPRIVLNMDWTDYLSSLLDIFKSQRNNRNYRNLCDGKKQSAYLIHFLYFIYFCGTYYSYFLLDILGPAEMTEIHRKLGFCWQKHFLYFLYLTYGLYLSRLGRVQKQVFQLCSRCSRCSVGNIIQSSCWIF